VKQPIKIPKIGYGSVAPFGDRDRPKRHC